MAISDETFGGVIVGPVEPQTIVLVSNRAGPAGASGFSGYSGTGGGGGEGGSGFCGASGFSGYSGRSGGSGPSGFSGFSGKSGYSGYSGVGQSGFSGYSGASGTSGAGGGNSGYSGYSGLDGTFSASGFSGFSGFSSRSGFSGYSGFSGSGFSGFSGISGFAQSGFSGFSGGSGPSGFSSFSGFSGRSGYSGFSGGPSGFSGFSGTGSPSGGAAGDMQFNDGSAGFSGNSNVNVDGTLNTFATSTRFFFRDAADPSKTARMALDTLPPGANVSVRVVGNSVTVIAQGATANQFVTGIDLGGNILKAQPAASNLSGLITYGQLDRSTAVVAETATLTIAANTKIKSTASGTLSTINFLGGDNAQQGRRLDLDITGGPYTLNVPACRRIGETGTITTLQVFAGYNEFSWEFINGEYVLSDSVSAPGGGGGSSGFSGFSGRSGYSAYSGYSGPAGAGSSGFSGFSGPGSSGFSGYSAPQLAVTTFHNDTDYTLIIIDGGTIVQMASTSPRTLTVPNSSTVNFPIGTQIVVEQGNTGLVTISGAVGVTLQGATSTSGVFSAVVLIKQASNTWFVARSGISGYSGYSGGAGGAGASGFSGFSGGGPSGFSGFSGPGSSGFSGYSSLSGFSGFSGKSGYSGYSAPQLMLTSTKTDTDYTLVLGDGQTVINMLSNSPHTITIPLNASVAFPIGTQIAVEQGGAGAVTIAAIPGVSTTGSTQTSGQYSLVVLIKQATDTWLISSGNSGYSGYSGANGGSGFSGYSGFSAFSGFSGTGGFTRLTVAGADATTTGQVLTNITGLVTGTLAVSTLYEFHALLKVAVSAVTTGIQYGIHSTGTGTVATVNSILTGMTATTSVFSTPIIAFDTATTTAFLTTSGQAGTIEIRGWITTTSAGTPTISLQHLKVTSGTSTVRIGSYLEYRVA